MLKTCLLSLLVIIDSYLLAQNFSYTQYGIRDGLAGSNVYAAIQDKEGFIWFATETGVSRFDGVHFKNFTIEDGLPDNEILNLFCDSKGRLWMMPFRKTICYYYKGKLYTQKNDSILKQLQVTGNIFGMAEDRNGRLALLEAYAVHLLKDTSIKKIQFSSPFQAWASSFTSIAVNDSGIINILSSKGVFTVYDEKLKEPVKTTLTTPSIGHAMIGPSFFIDEQENNITITFIRDGQTRRIGQSPKHLNFSVLKNGLFSDNTHDGAFIYSANEISFKEHHLPGRSIANVFRDNENNLWFCTQREGVYKLNSPYVSNKTFKSNEGKVLSVHSLLKYKENLWVGAEEGYLFTYSVNSNNIEVKKSTGSFHQIKVLLESNKKDLLIGGQSRLTSISSGTLIPEGSLKDIRPAFGNNILLSTSTGTWLINTDNLNKITTRITEAVWQGRTTTAHYSKDTFYIGTLDGLYKTHNENKIFAGDEDALLKSRIASIRETNDGTLWIATYDQGIVAYKNKKVLMNISKAQGLTSNICRNLFLHKNDLWVGTDNGLNKITIDSNKYRITKYTVADGLLSNFINAIFVDDSLVYVGTPDGVSYFEDKKISQHAPCILRLTDIVVSGRSIDADSTNFILKRRDNNIRFEFSGISYRSGGEITYRYSLDGLDTGWHTTKENFLNYPTLLPGNYTMKLQAINKFGIESEVISIPFLIKKFWWEKLWIRVLGGILLLGMAGIFMNHRIRHVRQREKEKTSLREQISMLEQMALKAQMNPHFIFNSLNSIQHYVVDKDVIGANKYIAGFSKLIRLTLDNSAKQVVTISEEIDYLSQYLELESMRTSGKFTYSVKVDPEVLKNGYTISPMLLQPFIENSIRHGIPYRNDSDGHISISIEEYDKGLRFILEDNGVGRTMSKTYKSNNAIEYQSKGIALTEQRIHLINKDKKEKISLAITDIIKDDIVEGTRVIMNYPN